METKSLCLPPYPYRRTLSTRIPFRRLRVLVRILVSGWLETLRGWSFNSLLPKGDQGIQGIQGNSITGAKGDKGDQGNSITGAKGDKGDQGNSITGAKGDKGDQGNSITGAKGDKGDQGNSITGAKGDKGDKGDTGDNGTNGTNGIQGIQGETGETGATGSVSTLISKTAHASGANDRHFELYSDNTGDSNKEVSLRFHQGNVYWGQIRFRSSQFYFTGGSDNSMYPVNTGALNATGDITGSGKLSLGTFAVQEGYMTSRTITLGDNNLNYGGGSGWNTNTAALMFECADNTEMAVHDSGTRVASLMYFEGGSTNRITIGRNMGWGTISKVNINGNVGINQSNPGRTLDVNGTCDIANMLRVYGGLQVYGSEATVNYTNAQSDYLTNGGSVQADPPSLMFGLYVQYSIRAQAIVVLSDERIKSNVVDINDTTALEQVRQLEPKYYEYKDNVKRGSSSVIGFIAQQVKEVLPRAVSVGDGEIPNIYEIATISSSNTVTFTNFNTSNLEGTNCTLIGYLAEDERKEIHITEVIDDHTVRVEEDLSEWGEQLFV